MKKITFILFALIAGTSFAQNNATAKVDAVIVTPIQIKVERQYEFRFNRFRWRSRYGCAKSQF